MKIGISSGKWLSQAKAMATSSSCRVCEARTFYLTKVM